METVTDLFSWDPKSLWMVTAAMKLKDSCSLEEKLWQACCCCWVASVVSDSVQPHRRQPTRLPRPWDSPSKNTGVGCHFLLQCMKVKSESEVAQSCPTLATLWTAAYQAPLSMGFSRQKYWSGVPLPSLPASSTSLVFPIFSIDFIFLSVYTTI